MGAGPEIGRPGCASNQVTNVTLRRLIVNTIPPLNGHGLDFHNVQHSVIDSCNVVNAYSVGILIETGSNVIGAVMRGNFNGLAARTGGRASALFRICRGRAA